MPRGESIVLFGEGKTEAVFLRHVCGLYRDELAGLRCKFDAGQGGSPRQIVFQLIGRHLQIGSYDRALVLLDEDCGTADIPKTWLTKHRISLVKSAPHCLEGLFLTLLDDKLPGKGRKRSEAMKRQFHKEYLKTDRNAEIVAKLNRNCPKLFPKEMIEQHRKNSQSIADILDFLKL